MVTTQTVSRVNHEPIGDREGVLLPCPLCGEREATIHMDLSEPTRFYCQECSNEFVADDVAAIIAKWDRVLRWVTTFPVFCDATEGEGQS